MITRKEKFEYAERILVSEFVKDMQQITLDIQENGKVIQKEFIDTVTALFKECYELQQEGKKNTVSILHICFLLSSCMTRSHTVLMALYDERFYFDPIEVAQAWKPEFILKYYESEMDLYEKKAKQEIIQFRYSDMQEIRLKYYEMYYQVIGEIAELFVPFIKENDYYNKVEKSNDFCVCYGKYMIPGCMLHFEL